MSRTRRGVEALYKPIILYEPIIDGLVERS